MDAGPRHRRRRRLRDWPGGREPGRHRPGREHRLPGAAGGGQGVRRRQPHVGRGDLHDADGAARGGDPRPRVAQLDGRADRRARQSRGLADQLLRRVRDHHGLRDERSRRPGRRRRRWQRGADRVPARHGPATRHDLPLPARREQPGRRRRGRGPHRHDPSEPACAPHGARLGDGLPARQEQRQRRSRRDRRQLRHLRRSRVRGRGRLRRGHRVRGHRERRVLPAVPQHPRQHGLEHPRRRSPARAEPAAERQPPARLLLLARPLQGGRRLRRAPGARRGICWAAAAASTCATTPVPLLATSC